MLVVFGDDVVIFSDKSCAFPNTGNLRTDWSRWYRRSIEKSATQVFGAERWIRQYPNRIYLDRSCTRPFPIAIPSHYQCRFHRVVVARNAADRCKSYFGEGCSGSLMIRPHIVGDAHHSEPFSIGKVDPKKGFVHIFDDYSLQAVMGELDTISDFVCYLSRKEIFITSSKLSVAAGEEELLAYYLTNMGSEGEHDFVMPPQADAIWLDEGIWSNVRSNSQYIAKKVADEKSYLWDGLIEHFSQNYAAGNLGVGGEVPFVQFERAIRIMASESRLARRGLSEAITDLFANTPRGSRRARVLLALDQTTVAYVILMVGVPAGTSYSQYQIFRRELLHAYILVSKLQNPELQHIIGFATEPAGGGGSSEDLIYFDASHWSSELQTDASRLQAELGILATTRRTDHHYDEYPVALRP